MPKKSPLKEKQENRAAKPLNKPSASKFLTDLKAGKDGELRVAQFLLEHFGASSFSMEGADKGFDFILKFKGEMKDSLWEVKTDYMAKKYNNLFFEYFCNKSDSGLVTTKSDFWAILIPHLDEVVIFCPKIMLKTLKESNFRNVTSAGDGKRVSGYVVPIDSVKEMEFTETLKLPKE